MQTSVRGTPVRRIVDSEQTFVERCRRDRTPVRAVRQRRGGRNGRDTEHDRGLHPSPIEGSPATRRRCRKRWRAHGGHRPKSPLAKDDGPAPPRHAGRRVRSCRLVVRNRGARRATKCQDHTGTQRRRRRGIRSTSRRHLGVGRPESRPSPRRSVTRPLLGDRAPRRRLTPAGNRAAGPCRVRRAIDHPTASLNSVIAISTSHGRVASSRGDRRDPRIARTTLR